MKIKICGVTTTADAELVAGAGADYIGINFWSSSKRHVSTLRGADVAVAARLVDPAIQVVGVFVNQSPLEVAQIADLVDLDIVQLHGDESPETVANVDWPVIKALAPKSEADVDRAGDYEDCEYLLVDAPSSGYGGSGQVASWTLAGQVVRSSVLPVFLAGGLSADNVAAAVAEVRPYGVDVASGVERSPGEKDPERVRAFVAAVRGAQL